MSPAHFALFDGGFWKLLLCRFRRENSKMSFKTAQSARRSGPAKGEYGPCHREFMNSQAEAKRRRPASPMWTLHQLHHQLDDVETTLMAIAALVQGRSTYAAGTLLGNCCTTDDKGIWLKGVPKVLASYLGQAPLLLLSTRSAVAHFRDQASALAADCDAVYAMLKPSIELEYRAMRRGESLVLPLILRARALLQYALAEAIRVESDEQSARPCTTTSDFRRS